MHIAMIADAARLEGERPLLMRLAHELASRDHRVTLLVPHALPTEMEAALGHEAVCPTILRAPMRVLPWLRRERVARLMDSFEKDPPRVICSFGDEGWPMGESLARELGCPLVFDISSLVEAKRVGQRRRSAELIGCIAATRPLADLVSRRCRRLPVRAVPWPVEIPRMPRVVFEEAVESKCLAVIGCGVDVPAHRALLTALSRLNRGASNLQVVYELRGRNDHEIWRVAQRLDLLECITFITSADELRELLVRSDALVMPERSGRMRSILLDAMASGLPIVALTDPCLDMLSHEKTACLVSERQTDPWLTALRRLLTDVEFARRIGRQARDLVTRDHDIRTAIDAYAEVFVQASDGDSLPFSATRRL